MALNLKKNKILSISCFLHLVLNSVLCQRIFSLSAQDKNLTSALRKTGFAISHERHMRFYIIIRG